MESFYINAMNVQNGHTEMHTVKADNLDQAIQKVESDDYISAAAPHGWEVLEDFC